MNQYTILLTKYYKKYTKKTPDTVYLDKIK